jgi:lambda repressor-like predicted transcriptional regulator
VDAIQIKAELKRRGLTITAVAQELRCAPATVWKVIEQISKSERIAAHLAGLLGVSVKDLFHDEVVTAQKAAASIAVQKTTNNI